MHEDVATLDGLWLRGRHAHLKRELVVTFVGQFSHLRILKRNESLSRLLGFLEQVGAAIVLGENEDLGE